MPLGLLGPVQCAGHVRPTTSLNCPRMSAPEVVLKLVEGVPGQPSSPGGPRDKGREVRGAVWLAPEMRGLWKREAGVV